MDVTPCVLYTSSQVEIAQFVYIPDHDARSQFDTKAALQCSALDRRKCIEVSLGTTKIHHDDLSDLLAGSNCRAN